MSSRVQTVLGDICPSELGRTLTHEHLVMDFSHHYRKPPKQITDKFEDNITLESVGYLRQYPYSSWYNLKLNDDDARQAIENDVMYYKKYGGGGAGAPEYIIVNLFSNIDLSGTIVENSTEGLGRDIDFLKEVSEKSGVNIVAGTGFYIADMLPDNVQHKTKEELYHHMLEELTVGCEGTDVKAGFMGEIASVWPIRDIERKAIIAAGELQGQVGCGVSFHPHRAVDAPFEIIRLYLEAGGSADKVVMSHLDRTLLDDDKLLEFAELNTYCQFDLFGVEVSYYQLSATTDMPSDAQRVQKIQLLIGEGRTDRVLMSHDIHTKHRLTDFGGHGYSHIINNVLPKMRAKEISPDIIDKITIDNPARWLSIAD